MHATISVICNKHKVLSNGESPIVLRIAKGGKRAIKSLGISINPSHWDEQKEQAKPICPNKKQIDLLVLKTKPSITLHLSTLCLSRFTRCKTEMDD
ncbi:hypothetical protein LJC39_00820 [Parabacteroides sp. OttesenSCG-928-B22]|nr:hypothetical protein [Parabacteroides sp. OttesenSCG-928-B22]